MVDLFFILSGFIMLHVYKEQFSNELKVKNYLGFLKARLARIYPLHFFTLLFLVFIYYASLNTYMLGDLSDFIHDPKAIPTHLFLLQSFGLHTIFTWNLTSWSVSAEWFSYLLFPILALFVIRKKNLAIILLSIGAILIYLLLVYYLPRSPYSGGNPGIYDLNFSFDWGFLRGLAGFISGMICYQIYKIKSLNIFLSKDFNGIVSIVLFIFVSRSRITDLIFIPVFMLILLSTVSNTQVLHKIFTLKPLQFVGKISYSIYMVHYILILCVLMPILKLLKFNYIGPGSLVPSLGVGLSMCAIFILIVIFFSSITYRAIEKPFRNWINRMKVFK